MSLRTSTRNKDCRTSILEPLAVWRRREILRLLLVRDSPVGERELAAHLAADERAHLAAGEREKPVDGTTRTGSQAVRRTLSHVDLPKLADTELVAWDRDEAVVTPTNHPALADPRFQQVLEIDGDDWDAILEALQSSRRRIVLALLTEVGTIERRELAHRVVARENGAEPAETPEREYEAALVQLHHVHLPMLRQAGLIGYDGERVRYAGPPGFDPEWFDGEFEAGGIER